MMFLWLCYLALGWLTTAGLSLPLGVQNSQVKNMLPWKQDTQFLQQQGDRHARSADIGDTGCPKGFFVDGYNMDNQLTPEAKCEPCPFGTYNEEEGNLSMKCSLCREACDRNQEVELEPCTPSSNRKCACAPGYQEERPEPELICIMDPGYMPCKAGQRIRFYGMEIMCENCPENTTSFGNNTICVPLYTTASFLTVTPHAAGSEQGISQWKALGIIIAVAFLLVVTIVSVVIYCCRRKKQKRLEGNNPIGYNTPEGVCIDDGLRGCNDSETSSAPPQQSGSKANGCAASNGLVDKRHRYIPPSGIHQPTDAFPTELTDKGELQQFLSQTIHRREPPSNSG